MALAGCGTPFPYQDTGKPHRASARGFVNLDPAPTGAADVPWYEVLLRSWRGDFKPLRPPQGGYEAFAERWRQPLAPAALEAAAQRATPQMVWLGHSGVWLQAAGQRILIDPQLSDHAGPTAWLGSKRRTPAPIAAASLPPVDVVLITHNHYDHLDAATLAPLVARERQPKFLVPLGLAGWMRGIGARDVEEIDWWDERSLGPLRLTLLPARHWSRRTLTDRNQSLWGGWAITWTPQVGAAPWRFVHLGDTGHSPTLFKTIRQRLGGPVDVLALPIGAYEPRDFMRPQHVNPDDAVQLLLDLQARQAFGIHWGTFELTQEPFDQPPQDLAAALKAHGLGDERVWLLRQGEVRALPLPLQRP